jgi:hypothetical protein
LPPVGSKLMRVGPQLREISPTAACNAIEPYSIMIA